jgi:hypothetical protein
VLFSLCYVCICAKCACVVVNVSACVCLFGACFCLRLRSRPLVARSAHEYPVYHGKNRDPVESAVEIAIAISTGRDYDRNLYW